MHVHNLFCMHMYMYRTEENWQCGPINVLSFAFADSIHQLQEEGRTGLQGALGRPWARLKLYTRLSDGALG